MNWMMWAAPVMILSGCAKDPVSACEEYYAVNEACSNQALGTTAGVETTETTGTSVCGLFAGLKGSEKKEAVHMFNCMTEAIISADCSTIEGYNTGATAAATCGSLAPSTSATTGANTGAATGSATSTNSSTGSAGISLTPSDCCAFEHTVGATTCPQEIGSISFRNDTTDTASHSVLCQPLYGASVVAFVRPTGGPANTSITGPLQTGTEDYTIQFTCGESYAFSVNCTATLQEAEGTLHEVDFQISGSFL